jgi:hypothetical protein
MFCGGARGMVLQRKRASCGRDSVDVDRACLSRVLENHPNQSVGIEHRSSLAGVISSNTTVCRCVLSGSLSAWRIAVRVRKTRGLGRHRCCRPGVGRGWRDAHPICEAAFAYLEHTWTYRYHFCRLQRAALWFKRLAVDARAAGTSTESAPDFSRAAYYCITRLDFRPASASENWFAVTAWQRSRKGSNPRPTWVSQPLYH